MYQARATPAATRGQRPRTDTLSFRQPWLVGTHLTKADDDAHRELSPLHWNRRQVNDLRTASTSDVARTSSGPPMMWFIT